MYIALADEEELSRNRADEVTFFAFFLHFFVSKIQCYFCLNQATKLASETLATNATLNAELSAARDEILRLRADMLEQSMQPKVYQFFFRFNKV
jgi:hypothetical protein